MLASWLRCFWIALVAVVTVWVLHFASAGRYGVAVLPVPLLLGLGLLPYALECLFVWRFARRASAVMPTGARIAWAALREARIAAAVFAWRLPFASQRWPDVPARPGNRGLLLVHGYGCNRGLWTEWLARLTEAGTPFVALNLEPLAASINHYAEQVQAAISLLHAQTGLEPVVVAHSMGGLAVRAWWQAAEHREQPGPRPHRLITIGTPHHGTALARFALTPNARQMRLASPWLQALNAAPPPQLLARMTCLYSDCDNVVVPARSATLAGAAEYCLPGLGHLELVDQPEAYAEALRQLRD